MANAIGQSATDLAPSTNGEESFDIIACVRRQAERTAKGITRERLLLNRNKLVSAACADYRMHFSAIYGKTERLPREIFDKVETAVDSFLDDQLKRINPMNVMSLKRGFYVNIKLAKVTDRIHLIGENELQLKEQLLGIHIAITEAKKRLETLMKKPNPDHDREKAAQERIVQLTLCETYIKGEIENQAKLVKE